MKTYFEACIWPLKNKLYRLAYLWVKDRDVANDVLQSVFEKAWQKREALQEMDNPTGWMVRSLKNESLQHYRASKRFEILADQDFHAEEPEPEQRAEQMNQVFRFLELLPDKQREIFQLREVEGLTYEEIADYLEISLDQVKVNLHRARKLLRAYLVKKKDERQDRNITG